jgi:hypothetical protein
VITARHPNLNSDMDKLVAIGPNALRRAIGIYYRGDAADGPRAG